MSPNLAHMKGWRAEYPSDLENYRSAVCAAIGPGPEAVLTITSNRIDHFRHPEAVEVLTARYLARIISLTGALYG